LRVRQIRVTWHRPAMGNVFGCGTRLCVHYSLRRSAIFATF
jgi:hypothetical protein